MPVKTAIGRRRTAGESPEHDEKHGQSGRGAGEPAAGAVQHIDDGFPYQGRATHALEQAGEQVGNSLHHALLIRLERGGGILDERVHDWTAREGGRQGKKEGGRVVESEGVAK